MRDITLVLAAIILLFSESGSMAMDKADLMVGMKTLPLLNNKITGNIKIAIVFDPGQADSRHEAEDIKSIINSGLDLPGDLNAEGIMVPANQLQGMAGSKIAIISSHLNAYYNAISDSAAMNKVLTISTDLDCVHENKCILGIVSKPRVEIYYSKIAAENANITFGQAFTMLVKPASY